VMGGRHRAASNPRANDIRIGPPIESSPGGGGRVGIDDGGPSVHRPDVVGRRADRNLRRGPGRREWSGAPGGRCPGLPARGPPGPRRTAAGGERSVVRSPPVDSDASGRLFQGDDLVGGPDDRLRHVADPNASRNDSFTEARAPPRHRSLGAARPRRARDRRSVTSPCPMVPSRSKAMGTSVSPPMGRLTRDRGVEIAAQGSRVCWNS